MMQTNPYLSIKDLKHSFSQGPDQVALLRGVSYQFEQGRSYAIVGPSGSGKSTLLALLSGLEIPTSGQVLFQGIDLFQGDVDKRLRLGRQLGVVFQIPYLIDELSLVENVMIKGLIEYQDYQEASSKAQLLIEKVGLKGKENQQPRSLSGGEQQRVCVARALFTEPRFIIADEPTAHLDEATARDIMAILCTYQQEHGAGLVIASHDMALMDMLDTTLRLEAGLLVEVPYMLHPGSESLSREKARYG